MIPPALHGRRVWLRVGTLLDGVSLAPLRHAHLVYDENKILFVGDHGDPPPAGLLPPGQSVPDLDLTDWTLLPGLIEAHAHFFLEGGELDPAKRAAWLNQSPSVLLQSARARLERLLRLGVIAVRDAGDKDGVGLALSKCYRSADRPPMPYVDSPGAAIHHLGRYGSFMGEPLENYPSLAGCVAARIQVGADRIKLIPTGIINFKQGRVTTEPQMSAAEVAELVRAAQSHGRQTFAHASGEAGIAHAIAGGVDSIEHGFFVSRDQLAEMRDRQIAWVPTFAPVRAQLRDKTVRDNVQKILDEHAASMVKGHEMGVIILAGSDAGSYGVPHGWGFLEELEMMAQAGLPNLAVINAATGRSSARLAFPENFGQIRVNYKSRFILTRHSPLESIANLQKPKVVVFDNAVFDSPNRMDSTGM